ncbi:MAG: serine hydrolase domain-containing protein, partial [Bacteroidota bacterium]
AQADQLQRATTSLRPDMIVAGEALWTLPERMQAYNVPGISIAVVQDFQLAAAKAYGRVQANLPAAPMTETTFQAASISKLVNAVGVLKLVENDQLDLDQDINELLSTWQIPNAAKYPDVAVTTRMLLAHTAGLTTHGFGGYKSPEDLPSTVEILNKAPGVNSGAVKLFKKPGGSFKYSGGGTVVTQLLIEELTGQSYEDYMQQTVLRPLGMTQSFYSVNQQGREDQLATAHWSNGKALKGKYHHYPESAPAGLWTTPSDLAKLMIDLMLTFKGETGHLLNPATAKEMLTPPNQEENNALGLFLRDKNGHLYFTHGGSNEGFKANFIGSTTEGFGAIVMHNGEQYDLIPEVLNGIAQAYAWPDWFGAQSTIDPNLKVDKAAWKGLTGKYVHEEKSDSKLEIIVKKGQLRLLRRKAFDLPLIPFAPNQYLLKGANPQVTVEFLAAGRIKVVQGEENYFRKE